MAIDQVLANEISHALAYTAVNLNLAEESLVKCIVKYYRMIDTTLRDTQENGVGKFERHDGSLMCKVLTAISFGVQSYAQGPSWRVSSHGSRRSAFAR